MSEEEKKGQPLRSSLLACRCFWNVSLNSRLYVWTRQCKTRSPYTPVPAETIHCLNLSEAFLSRVQTFWCVHSLLQVQMLSESPPSGPQGPVCTCEINYKRWIYEFVCTLDAWYWCNIYLEYINEYPWSKSSWRISVFPLAAANWIMLTNIESSRVEVRWHGHCSCFSKTWRQLHIWI